MSEQGNPTLEKAVQSSTADQMVSAFLDKPNKSPADSDQTKSLTLFRERT